MQKKKERKNQHYTIHQEQPVMWRNDGKTHWATMLDQLVNDSRGKGGGGIRPRCSPQVALRASYWPGSHLI